MVDYPGKIALTLFTSSCNFDCAYCHNSELKKPIPERLTEESVFEHLQRRIGLIDAVVISGGEPTLRSSELIPFIGRLRKNFPNKLVKIDTNGWNPTLLEAFLKLVDFVAMDLKALDYSLFSDSPFESVLESLRLVKNFPEHELRITVYPEYIKPEHFQELANLCEGSSRVAIQQYRNNGGSPIKPYSSQLLQSFSQIMASLVKTVLIRD